MIDCAYCERPLICESCRTPYSPRSQDEYEALSQTDAVIECHECGSLLVCRWCKFPYDGQVSGAADEPAAHGGH